MKIKYIKFANSLIPINGNLFFVYHHVKVSENIIIYTIKLKAFDHDIYMPDECFDTEEEREARMNELLDELNK